MLSYRVYHTWICTFYRQPSVLVILGCHSLICTNGISNRGPTCPGWDGFSKYSMLHDWQWSRTWHFTRAVQCTSGRRMDHHFNLMHASFFYIFKRLFVIKLVTTWNLWIFDGQNYFQPWGTCRQKYRGKFRPIFSVSATLSLFLHLFSYGYSVRPSLPPKKP
jgi:hypothetical protein